MRLPSINIPPPPAFLFSIPLSSYINALVALMLLIIVVREPLELGSVFLSTLAGFNLAAAIFGYLMARSDKVFDRMSQLVGEVLEANHHNKIVFDAVLHENQQLKNEIDKAKQAKS